MLKVVSCLGILAVIAVAIVILIKQNKESYDISGVNSWTSNDLTEEQRHEGLQIRNPWGRKEWSGDYDSEKFRLRLPEGGGALKGVVIPMNVIM